MTIRPCHHPRCKNPSLGYGYGCCADHLLERIDTELTRWTLLREWVLSKRLGQQSLEDAA